MAYLSNSDWSLVVKAVEDAGGIRQTGGTAGRLIRDAISKGSFSSRSEAGRYAAQQRWKGHVKATPDQAVDALTEGKPVAVESGKQIFTLIQKIGEFAQQQKSKGEKVDTLDLCKVSIPGTNLFCGENIGKTRIEMPQLSGKPVEGSKGDKLPKDSKGRINIGEAFQEALAKEGIETVDGEVPASTLRASQKELIGDKVAGIMGEIAGGKMDSVKDTIFVSKDGYVVDGHHRWAAKIGLDMRDGGLGDVRMKVKVINLGIEEVLARANAFAEEMGIPPQKAQSGAH
jgi:Arc/MetJ-type ribon-helix-helix transcriptional regulator